MTLFAAEFGVANNRLSISLPGADLGPGRSLFVALSAGKGVGSAVVPFAEKFEGSTVFLPFQADHLYLVQMNEPVDKVFQRRWEHWTWSDRQDSPDDVVWDAETFTLRLPQSTLPDKLAVAVYAKDFRENTWGRLIAAHDPAVAPGEGDRYLPYYCEVDCRVKAAPRIKLRARHGNDTERPRIYQLLVRLFGNTNETRLPNGAMTQNGVGKFNDINDAALASLQQLGFSHLWLTGVLEQATGTDHSDIGHPADDPDLLKGIAGSPYAIKDYFDVCPDYAVDPGKRLEEFKALLDRLHRHQLRGLIDFVPNHVARCYHSDIKPESNFGVRDDRTRFFDPSNNFFYLQPASAGPPLKLPTWENGVPLSPTCKLRGLKCDGRYDGEKEYGRVTGNNVASWTPSLSDWYETVKLNYGFDFTDPAKQRAYPSALHPGAPVPDTWTKMDQIIAYWQAMGVDGFRCDMSHMVPPEFWKWLIARSRTRDSSVVFIGEAYDGDPARVPGNDPIISQLRYGKSNVMVELLDAGFDAVYDDPSYKTIKSIYDGTGWANDLDRARSDDFIFGNSVRYAENHDEVRLASRGNWGGVGMNVGRVVAAILFSIGQGSVMLYNGQEVGEPGSGAEGFGGDDTRTSIFDYWSMPEVVKWTNAHKYDGGRLSAEQISLRESYRRLLTLTNEPAFRNGGFFALNPANLHNPNFGQVGAEPAGGHWLYAFLRYDAVSDQRFLVVVNLHPTSELRETHIVFPLESIQWLQLAPNDDSWRFCERLVGTLKLTAIRSSLESSSGLPLPTLAPLTAYFFEIISLHE
jgi:glycosidase